MEYISFFFCFYSMYPIFTKVVEIFWKYIDKLNNWITCLSQYHEPKHIFNSSHSSQVGVYIMKKLMFYLARVPEKDR